MCVHVYSRTQECISACVHVRLDKLIYHNYSTQKRDYELTQEIIQFDKCIQTYTN